MHAVLHADKDLRPPTINAVVHFATGDVAVVLTQSGKGAAYHGTVPVPAAEPTGEVKIDATAVVDGATLTATGRGKIIAKTDKETTETSTASTTTTSTTTCTATSTETVTSTVTSTSSVTSTTTETTATDESEESESSEASESSESESSEASEDSQGEDSQGEDSDECEQETTNAPAIVLTPQSIREIVAYFVALMNRS